MEVTLLLANAAETSPNGLVHALGLGWTVCSTPPPPAAMVMCIRVPWDQTNVDHALVIELVDADGQPVMLGQDQHGSPAPLQLTADYQAGRPPGHPHGAPIEQTVSFSIGPGMPLVPGTYQWRVSVSGEPVAGRSFMVVGGQPLAG